MTTNSPSPLPSGPRRRRPAPLLPSVLLLALVVAPLRAVEEPLEDGWMRFSLSGRAFALAEWGASSVLESDHYWEVSRYDPGKALDGDPATAWVEGAPGPGIGEFIVLGLTHYPEALGFINGFARDRNLFAGNNRVKELNVRIYTAVNISGFATEWVTFYDALPVAPAQTVRLADTMEAQRVELPLSSRSAREAMDDFRASDVVTGWSFAQARELGVDASMGAPLHFRYIVRLQIADVYPGTTWDDTCIAEIWPDYGRIDDVTVSDDNRHLLLTTAYGERVPGYADFEYVLTVVELSQNHEWAIVIKEPAYPGTSRISSEYAVIHTPTGHDMTAAIFGRTESGGLNVLPFDFVEEDSTTFVIYEEFTSGETRRAACRFLY